LRRLRTSFINLSQFIYFHYIVFIMANFLPTAADEPALSPTQITDSYSTVDNATLLTDNNCTIDHASLNFCCAPNPLAKICFSASCICILVALLSSSIALATSNIGITFYGTVESIGTWAFNCLVKYRWNIGI
jgi:hypothetical protein